jgi:flagellar assembly protein FliH
MSSSKVFKGDTQFTPLSLIRESIELPVRTMKSPAPSSAPNHKASKTGQETTTAPAKEASSTTPPPAVEPVSPPQPQIDIEAIRQEAFQQGAADLAHRLQSEFTQTINAFALACQKVDELHQQRLANGNGQLINLVMALTEKILGQELATPRHIIADTLQQALEQAISSEEFQVTLHPDDLSFAEARAPELITAIRGLQQLTFKTDSAMLRGGCLLESVACTVDATIEGQLAATRDYLLEHPELVDTDETMEQSHEEPPAENENS